MHTGHMTQTATPLDDTTPRPRSIKVGWRPYLDILVAAVHGAGHAVSCTRAIDGVVLSYEATDAEERDIRLSARPAILRERAGY